jgi:hypothetical protein
VLGDPAWTRRQPGHCLWMLPGGVSCRARNGIGLTGRDFVLDGIEEADEFAVSVALHPAGRSSFHRVVDHTQPSLPIYAGAAKTMTHDYKCHGTNTVVSALSVLWIWLFHRAKVPRHGPGIGLKANHVGALAGKGGIAQESEGTHAMRLQLVGPPDTSHRAQRNVRRLGECAACQMGGLGVRHPL